MTSKRDQALALARKGFRIFRLAPGTKDKPLGKWKDIATADLETVREWWTEPVTGESTDHNIGIAMGQGVVALDFDAKDNKKGLESFNFLETMDVQMISVASTPSGGRHAFFRIAPDIALQNRVDSIAMLPGVDVRSDGGYVLGAGSVVDNVPYEWIAEPSSTDALSFLPDWVIEQCGKAKERPGATAASGDFEFDTPADVNRATDYLLRLAPEAIQGQGGDRTTVTVAAKLKDFGISKDKALDLMLDHWNGSKAAPPWKPDDLEIKVRNAYVYCKENQPGSLSARAEFTEPAPAPIVRDDQEDEEEDDESLSGADLAAGDFPLPEYLIEPFVLAENVCSLYGDGGLGKTTVLLYMAVSVASGKPFFGIEVKQRPVLLLLTEDPYGIAKGRLERICGDYGVRLEDIPLRIWCRTGRDSNLARIEDNGEVKPTSFLSRLRAEILKMGDGPKLTLLDTLSDLAEIDGNKTPAANAFCKKLLGRLSRQTESSILFSAHPSKTAMHDGSGYGGAVPWKGAVRVLNILEPRGGYSDKKNRTEDDLPEEYPHLTLRTHKANWSRKQRIDIARGKDGFFTRMDPRNREHREQLHREYCYQKVAELRSKGISVVQSHGNGQKPKDLAKAVNEEHRTDMTATEAKGHLAALEREGRIKWEPRQNDRNHQAGYRIIGDSEVTRGAEGQALN